MHENDIIEIIDDIDNGSSQQSINTDINNKVSTVKYDPIEPEKESIEILDDVEPTKSKSGIILLVILFVLLGLFILFLPKIINIFGNLVSLF